MEKLRVDLHLHSLFSDGRLNPADLIAACRKENLRIVALTDHENVGGIPEAVELGRVIGIKVLPGIEFSASFYGMEHHLLGLGLDYSSPMLGRFLTEWAKTKKRQIKAMVKNLQERDFVLTINDVEDQTYGSFNRAHIAYAIFERKENRKTLKELNLKNTSDFFVKFLKEDSPVYVKRDMPRVAEVIRLIKNLGGVAIWAHPIWKDSLPVIKTKAAFFRKVGLDGLEVVYSSDYQNQEETLGLHAIARELSMVETAGSDFHSFEMPFLNKIAKFDDQGLELNLPEIARL